MPDIKTADDKAVAALMMQDQAALGEVIDRYTAYVGTIVWNIVGGRLSRPEAEEIISDVFLALWYNADKVQTGKLKSYLAVIARRKALNALRNAKFDVSLDDDKYTAHTKRAVRRGQPLHISDILSLTV